jgi:hypothetical protein
MFSEYKTEQVGISAEIAIADITGVPIDASYRTRGKQEIIDHLTPSLVSAVAKIPKPIKHIAGDQNPVDFMLVGNRTLSVKSNMRQLGKVAPQNIGQPTSQTFWSKLPELVPPGIDVKRLTYQESAKLFKQVAQSDTSTLLNAYWENLFDCDFLIYVFNVLDANDNLSNGPSVKVYEKSKSPIWDMSKIEFSQSLLSWNESCTVKYRGSSIGEFQVHNNRNCFKFRFNLSGLIDCGLL